MDNGIGRSRRSYRQSYFCGLSREAAGVFLTFKHNVLYKKASIFPLKTSLKKKDRQTDEKWNNFTFD